MRIGISGQKSRELATVLTGRPKEIHLPIRASKGLLSRHRIKQFDRLPLLRKPGEGGRDPGHPGTFTAGFF
ncbi:hypothetical protein A3J44_06110 [candidate division WOR-1 bacterium RIFCSPHIGHO2_02_FULL_45_12]|nr:MAG: hypothetical protein A3J44_06110 [candidate division WOR-1 bacterium RIFCSPHIGHO2_02_FULL_45_12]